MCDKVKVAVRVRPLNKRENGKYVLFILVLILYCAGNGQWKTTFYMVLCMCFRGGHLLHSGGEGELHPAPFSPPAGGHQVHRAAQRKFISWRPRSRSSWSNWKGAGSLERATGARNLVGIGLSYRPARIDSLESIPGLLKNLKIPSWRWD